MRAYVASLKFGYRQITRDNMLLLMIFGPILCGVIFKYGIPILEEYISERFGLGKVLVPYYLLFDTLLSYIALNLICTVSSFIILEEHDDDVAAYLFVTPIGYSGYIFTRIITPIIIAFFLSLIVMVFFNLSKLSFPLILSLIFLSMLYSAAVTLFIVSKAKNKVEGLALTKLSGIVFVGLLVPFFVNTNIQFLFGILPSFWLAKASVSYGTSFFIPSLLLGAICSIFWISIFYKKFKNKLF
jgi:fluoroquinolone transport system permease protein